MIKDFVRHIRRSIFPKIIAMFLLILLPLYTASLLVNQRGEDNVRKEITGSVQARAHYFSRSLEREIERLTQLQQQYVNDRDLMDLSASSAILNDFQISQAINGLYGRLQLLEASSPYIQSVSVHLSALNKTVTTKGFVLPLEREKFNHLKLTRSQSSGPVLVWSDRLFVRSVYPDRVYSEGQNPLYVLEAELSAEALREELARLLEPGGGAALLQGGGWRLSSEAAPGLASELSLALTSEDAAAATASQTASEPASLRLVRGEFLIVQTASSALNARLTVAAPERELFGPLRAYRLAFWALLALSVGAAVIFALWIFRYIHRPLLRLTKVFRQMESGNLELELDHRSEDEFRTVFEQFNRMVRKLRAAIDELYEQRLHIQRAELKQLQANIHPHFLYNTFYMIYRMAKVEDTDSVRKIARHLGDYFRFMTRNPGDEVPLALEVEHARNYLEIQAFRFGNRITASFGDIPPGCETLPVPKLILQPLIENAFHHGLEHKSRDGRLEVTLERDAGMLVIAVLDNGTPPAAEALAAWQARLERTEPAADAVTEVTGTVNVHRRLRLKFGPAAGVTVSLNDGGGVTAALRFPVQEGGEKERHVPTSDRG